MMRLVLAAAFGVTLLLMLSFSANGQFPDPMQYCASAESIRDLAAYQTGSTVEIYVIFVNPNRQGPTFNSMVSTSGKLTVSMGSQRPLNDYNLSCSEFKFFTRGIQQEPVLAFVLQPVPLPANGLHRVSARLPQAPPLKTLEASTTMYVSR